MGFGINIPDRYGDPVKPLNISVENVFVQYPKITATGEKDAASDIEVDAEPCGALAEQNLPSVRPWQWIPTAQK